jgi:hypothetical protein
MDTKDRVDAVPSTSATTIQSLDRLHTHLAPSTPSHYLTRHIASTLLRRGFQGAEAGALTEIERLLEHRKLPLACETLLHEKLICQICMLSSLVQRTMPAYPVVVSPTLSTYSKRGIKSSPRQSSVCVENRGNDVLVSVLSNA